MNTAPLHSTGIPGFRVIPKHQLGDVYHGPQSAFYVLLGRHGAPEAPRESIVFVDYLDDFVDCCQQQIDKLWDKHRVMITHVAVKLSHPFRATHRNLTGAYERAVALQSLRHQLNPKFRRL